MTRFDVAMLSVRSGRPAIPTAAPDRLDRARPVARVGPTRPARRGPSVQGSYADSLLGLPAGGQRVLDAFPVATIHVEREGRILHANHEARRILDSGAGLARAAGNHLSAQTPCDSKGLRDAIIAGCNGTPAWATVSRSVRGDPLFVMAVPAGAAAPRFGEAILMINDPERESPALVGHLQSLFGLTRAEAEVAVGLGRGHDLAEIGAARGVKRSTLRDQISSIFAKTETTRQAQLASLVSRLAVFG